MLKLAKRMSFWAVAGAVVFMIIQVVSDLYLPTLTADIINNGVAKGDTDYIWSVGFKMLGFSLISIAAATGNVFLAARQSQKLVKILRSEIYTKVTNFSNDEIDEIGTASLITRTTNDVIQIQNVVMMFLRMMIMAPIMLIGASFLAYSKDGQLTQIFLYVLPILAIFIGVVMFFAVPLFKAIQKKTDKLNLVFREGLTGIRVIRAFNRSKSETERFAEANKDFMDTSIKVNTIMSLMLPVMTFIMSGTNIAIIWFGGQYIGNGTLEVGNLLAFMTYAMQILMSFMMLSMVFIFIPRGQASAVRINEVLNMDSKIKDPENPAKLPAEKQGTLDFNHVDFRYTGAENLALKDIDFHGKNGQTIAIIGGTGSGKSTLSNLLDRFYDVENGSIEINGVDIRQMKQQDLRDAVGYVPQKAMLFTGTIRENLKYGNPDATDEELWHALEIVQSKNFVAAMPEGLDSYVEQGGGNFSGGQKQRLCIARALVKKADIYVFDDSFSALDFKTDAALRKALKPETRESVVVLVAQRISTVIDADIILVLDEGQLVGQGTHEELKATNETYQEIINSQLRGEEI
ncbi:multidrug ABC transporter ATP-binding protein [Carnobacterium maltaromaticum]|uniref:ABC transporter ATP-binding protein n=1 Tax=Carnobacterium maltaromaticum TaxID=2751 RepID=UPI000C784908|nr:ABC transporter ATP-binding protein [Carnobacterium maltaromaticum]PLS39257.1 multidrug ABC transporter ATP-binding protein [Carnobacterium maltaromaticum]PLS40066.1 multidrug ABC transporter ATP-binding protein [Carnobacterium maltaromaticum]PLS40403.1 multidrug ABC transporter ATP-binding protein [Carnobacterium maltaromaticum]PLS46046.1 multidrug ABC transporter ATP-binding protein [Carnobacterium maltaromaticum]PLS47198.1 multidrug ABC transporter ATP-binding protein [Carnobacterium mal